MDNSQFVIFPIDIKVKFDKKIQKNKIEYALDYYKLRKLVKSIPIYNSRNYGICAGMKSMITVIEYDDSIDIDFKRDYNIDFFKEAQKTLYFKSPQGTYLYFFQYEVSLPTIYNTIPGINIINDLGYVFAGKDFKQFSESDIIQNMSKDVVNMLETISNTCLNEPHHSTG